MLRDLPRYVAPILIGFVLLCSIASCSPNQTGLEQEAANIKKSVTELVSSGKIPGAVVYLIDGGEVKGKLVAGFKDIEAQKPLKEDDIFRLYSMSKPLTSTAIMMLVDQQKLTLDTPLEEILPEFSNMQVYVSGDLDEMVTEPIHRSITMLDLLRHHSGITYHFMGNSPVHAYYRKYGVMRDTPVGREPGDGAPAESLDQLMERLGKAPLLHQPGQEFAYSYSTTVLGAVVEKITGKALNIALKEMIFDPLEMSDTKFLLDEADASRFVVNYMMTEDGIKRIEDWENTDYKDPSRLLDGGGAIAGTGADYLHFVQMLGQGGIYKGRRILSQESLEVMVSNPINASFGNVLFDFGLGFEVGSEHSSKDKRLPLESFGWSGSGNTYFWINPKTGDGVVFMTQVILPPKFQAQGDYLRRIVFDQISDEETSDKH